jgi:hypothetical protein
VNTTPLPPTGTDCAEHPGRQALAYCGACFRPICGECRDASSTEPRCRECSIKEILTEVREDWATRDEKRAQGPLEEESWTGQPQFWRRFVLTAITVLLGMLVLTTFPASAIRGRTLYAVNLPAEGTPGLNGCLREMWDIRGELELYLGRHGAVPHSLAEVYNTGIPVCPVSEEQYSYVRIDNVRYVLRCPQPQDHEVGAIRVYSGSAPTILERPEN